MNPRPFMQVDVFTDRPYRGNPVAVILDANGLGEDEMLAIARWTNLSETTFVLAPDAPGAHYRLRIFTPVHELPFAGHPTLGSAFAVAAAGIARPEEGRLVQQCAAGLVPVRFESPDRVWLRLPAARVNPLPEPQRRRLSAALGIDCPEDTCAIDVGPVWITVRAPSGPAVLALRPDQNAIAALSRELGVTGVTVFGEQVDGDTRFEVRSFAPAANVPEDPVCGSGNGCVAVMLARGGERQPYLARQGRAIGRDGFVAVGFPGDGIEIGGSVVTCIRGEISA